MPWVQTAQHLGTPTCSAFVPQILARFLTEGPAVPKQAADWLRPLLDNHVYIVQDSADWLRPLLDNHVFIVQDSADWLSSLLDNHVYIVQDSLSESAQLG